MRRLMVSVLIVHFIDDSILFRRFLAALDKLRYRRSDTIGLIDELLKCLWASLQKHFYMLEYALVNRTQSTFAITSGLNFSQRCLIESELYRKEGYIRTTIVGHCLVKGGQARDSFP